MYRCPQFIYPVIFTAKFKNVKNAGEIRQRIVKAATMEGPEGNKERDAVNFAFINARLVCAGCVGRRRCSSPRSDYKSTAAADRRCAGAVCRVDQDVADKEPSL